MTSECVKPLSSEMYYRYQGMFHEIKQIQGNVFWFSVGRNSCSNNNNNSYSNSSSKCIVNNKQIIPSEGKWAVLYDLSHVALVFQAEGFISKRQKQYKSDIVKTHLLGKPTIAVLGLEHTKRILQSEHTLVSHEWPATVNVSYSKWANSVWSLLVYASLVILHDSHLFNLAHRLYLQ